MARVLLPGGWSIIVELLSQSGNVFRETIYGTIGHYQGTVQLIAFLFFGCLFFAVGCLLIFLVNNFVTQTKPKLELNLRNGLYLHPFDGTKFWFKAGLVGKLEW